MGGSDEDKYDHPTQKTVDLMRSEETGRLRRDNAGAAVARQLTLEVVVLRRIVPVCVECEIGNAARGKTQARLIRRRGPIRAEAAGAAAVVGGAALRPSAPGNLEVEERPRRK